MGRPGVSRFLSYSEISPSSRCPAHTLACLDQPDAAAYLLNALDMTNVLTPEELITKMEVHLDGAFRSVQPLPGTLKLVRHLHRHKIPMAVRDKVQLDGQAENSSLWI